jgi:hypothetical protein
MESYEIKITHVCDNPSLTPPLAIQKLIKCCLGSSRARKELSSYSNFIKKICCEEARKRIIGSLPLQLEKAHFTTYFTSPFTKERKRARETETLLCAWEANFASSSPLTSSLFCCENCLPHLIVITRESAFFYHHRLWRWFLLILSLREWFFLVHV